MEGMGHPLMFYHLESELHETYLGLSMTVGLDEVTYLEMLQTEQFKKPFLFCSAAHRGAQRHGPGHIQSLPAALSTHGTAEGV